MKYLIKILSPLVMVISLLGCKENTIAPSFGCLTIELDKLEVSVNKPIEVKLVNCGSFLAYIPHCNFETKPIIEKEENDNWIIYHSPVCLAIYPSGQIEFEAGKEIISTININEIGTYRIAFHYGFKEGKELDEIIYSENILVN